MTDLEQFIATCEAHAVPDNEIDFSDIPELTDEQIAQMKPSHLVNKNMWKPPKKVSQGTFLVNCLRQINDDRSRILFSCR